jgi:hypothetical protein
LIFLITTERKEIKGMTKHDKVNFWLLLVCLIGAILCISKIDAQTPPGAPFSPQITNGTAVPSLCNNGQLFYHVNNYDWYTCGPTNTYNKLGGPGVSGVSSFNTRTGAVVLINADVTAATGQALDVTGSPTFVTLTAGKAVLTGAPPTTTSGQIGYGASVTANTNCGTLMSSAGCVTINVAGTVHYIPYY